MAKHYVISTAAFPAEHRIEMWMEMFAKKMFKTQWDVPQDAEFFAGMNPLFTANDIYAIELGVSPVSIVNTPSYAAEKAGMLSFYVPLQGKGVSVRKQEAVPVSAYVGALIDEEQYYNNMAIAPFTSGLVIGLSEARLRESIPDIHSKLNAPYDGHSRAFGLFASYLRSLGREPLLTEPDALQLTSNYLLDLLVLHFGGASADGAAQAQMRGLAVARLKGILAYVEEHLSDPTLSGITIAQHFGVSQRYVQQLMEREGETLTEYLTRRRLENVKKILLNPAHRHRRISEIAYSCGFSDLSNFNRYFKRRFGESPRAQRRH